MAIFIADSLEWLRNRRVEQPTAESHQ